MATTPRKTKSPASYKILALNSFAASADSRFADIEAALDTLAEDGWTVHITQVDLTISQLTVYGWATKP